MTHHYQCQPYQALLNQYPNISPKGKIVDHAVRWPQWQIQPFVDAAKDLAEQLDNCCPMAPSPISVPKGNLFDCVSVDFAITEGGRGKLTPKLIELQAFPSIHHICLSIERDLSFTSQRLDGRTWQERNQALRASVTAGLPKEKVVMLDQSPLTQRSALDFVLAGDMVTVKAIDEIFIYHGEWVYLDELQRPTPFSRVYNRCIFHTLTPEQQKKLTDMSNSETLSWFAHPGWFYQFSKAVIPHLNHGCIPETHAFNSFTKANPAGWVLKDIDSVSGKGVMLSPSQSDIEQAALRPEQHIWQERVQYEAWLKLPRNPVVMMAEMRVMLLRQPQGWMAISLMLRTAHNGHISEAMNNNRPGEGITVLMEVAP